MKEKETVTVVCSHCGQPHEVEVKKKRFFYKEAWEQAKPWKVECAGFYAENETGLTMEEWQLCRVDITREEFIQSILDRLSTLEAVLTQKGGLR